MNYELDVAPDARAVWRTLDFEVQEAVFDLLDQLALDGRRLSPIRQRHLLVVTTAAGRTFASLTLSVFHERRVLHLDSIRAVVF